MADSKENHRYTSKVANFGSSLDALSEAKAALLSAISQANSKAKPFLFKESSVISQDTENIKNQIKETKSEVIQEEIKEDPEDLPDISLPSSETIKNKIVKIEEVHAVPDKIKDLLPGERPKSEIQSIEYIKTDLEEEQIKIPDPKSFNTTIWRLPEKPEPITIVSVMVNHFKTAWVDWEPEVIRKRVQEMKIIPETVQGSVQEEIIYDGIFAIQLIFSHSGVLDFWNMFEKVTKALNGVKVDMSILQPTHPKEMVYSIRTIKLLRPDLIDDQPGEELCKYIAACAFKEGFLVVPGDLRVAQKYLNTLMNSNEFDSLAEALWNAETRLYNMSDEEFDRVLSKFEATEDTKTIQTIKNISVIQYVREKGNITQQQLG